MKSRSFAISLVLLGSSACVVLSVPDDDDVGELGEVDGDGDSTEESTESESTGTESTATDSTDAAESDSTDETDTGGPPDTCEGIGYSTVPGVCIWFPTAGDTWTLAEVAQGIAIPYHVIVEADVPDVVPLPQDAGECGQPDASGLIVFARLTGDNGDEYCLCDAGNCPFPSDPPVTIPAGDTPLEFEWTGVNWFGPSDTNEPFGPPFPAGVYELSISAVGNVGGVPFTVSNTFAITLE